MNLRTTIVLLVLLAVAGLGIWWFTSKDVPVANQGRRLLPGLVTSDVTKVVMKSERSDAPFKGALTLQRGPEGTWTVQLGDERPVEARAEKIRTTLEMLREASFVRELSSASKDALGKFGLDAGQRILVELTLANGSSRVLAVGAVVSESGIAARPDDRWPPVEVDQQIKDELVAGPEVFRERRIAAYDATLAQSLRATFPKHPESNFFVERESGQWQIREPSLMRADQALIMRLLSSLSSLESSEPFVASPPPSVLVRYEIMVSGRKTPWVVEIGDGTQHDMVPARGGSDPQWFAVSLAGLETITQPGSHFRNRKLLPFEPESIKEVLVTREGQAPIHIKRGAGRFVFEPPDEWNWNLRSKVALPLDPSFQSDFLQLLVALEASDFNSGGAFEAERTITVKHGTPESEVKLRFGADKDGLRPLARFSDTVEGHVRSTDLKLLEKPYWELLARQAYAAAWFSLSAIEVEEVGKRRVLISATATGGNSPDFILTDPHGDQKRRVPRELLTAVTEKICLLTVEKFVGHGPLDQFGLNQPQYLIKWLDSGKSQGTPPDSRVGQWITWRVGRRGPDALNDGNLDIEPGLVFKTGPRDLDPFISLLEWAFK